MNAVEATAFSRERPGKSTMHFGDTEISVIIPVFRNPDTLEELHRRLTLVLNERYREYEIIFVDDVCPAGSLPILRRLADRDPRVMVLSLAQNVGQHSAVLIGLAHADGEWSVIMDADLQDPPEAIETLAEAAGPGTRIVFAGRRGRYESYDRLLTSRLFKRLLHLCTGVPKDAGIFMALHRDVADRILQLRTSYPFIQVMVASTGLPMVSVPVERAQRPSGASAYSSLKRLKAGMRGFACWLSLKLPFADKPFIQKLPAGLVSERIGDRFIDR